MAKKTTRLGYILGRLGLRPGELARLTGIDKTLISRWRSGQRHLAPTGGHTEKIVACLLAQEGAASLLGKTLLAYGLDENTGTLAENLAFWLSEQEAPTPALGPGPKNTGREYTASFSVFLGQEGLRSAIITLIDYMASLSKSSNIIAVMQGDYQWFTGNPEFLELLLQRLGKAYEHGVTITLINRDDFTPGDIAQFSGPWLAAHLQGMIRSYYYPAGEPMGDNRTVAASKGGICLRLNRDDSLPDSLYAAMYTDEVTVQLAYNICSDFLAKAQPQFQYNFLSNPGSFLQGADDEALLRSSSYTIARVPAAGLIPPSQVYLYTGLTRRDTKTRVEQLSALTHTPNEYDSAAVIRQVYCIESIDELFYPGRHPNPVFSAAFEKQVNFPRRMVHRLLGDIRNWLEMYKNFEVLFVPRRIFDKIPLELITVKDHFTVAWLPSGEQSTCVRNQTKTEALYGFAAHVWDGIPKYYKNRQSAIRQITKWIGPKQPQ